MRIKSLLSSLSVIAAVSASAVHATPILINGNFEKTTAGGNQQLAASTDKGTTLTGWTSSNGNDGGYNFVLDSKIASTNASRIALKGVSASPDGGNFFASDAMYHPGMFSQTVDGLAAGGVYTLTFYYALAQQSGYTGVNNDNYWEVGFGKNSANTTYLSMANGEFTGWKAASMTFTSTGASEVLSFLAKGTAPGAPPFMLLDGVKLTSAVPEPSSWALVLGGLGLMGLVVRRRRATGKA